MRKRQLVAIVLVVLLVTSGIALAKARGSPDLSVSAPSNEFTPGEDGTLELYLENAGDVAYATSNAEQSRVTTARNVRITLEPGNAPFDVETGTQPIGNVPEGVTDPIAFEISVDDDAEAGEYELTAEIEYRHTEVIGEGDGAYDERERTVSRDVTVVVEDGARFEIVEASGADLFSTTGPVSLTLENTGTAAATDARVAVESGSGQLTFGGDQAAETYVGDWGAGEMREVTLQGELAEGADRRNYPLAATVSYDDADGDAAESETLRTGISPREDTRFGLSDVASTLTVGEEGTVSGTITNLGESTAGNAVVVLSANSETVDVVESEYSVGDLAPGEFADVDYDVEVSEASAGGPRQFSFQVQFRDRSHEQRESDQLDARVEVGDQRDVFAVRPVNATVEAGGGGLIGLEVTNQDDGPVSEVSAKLFANSPISATDDEAFVDSLAPGDSATVRFGISAGPGALEKVYPVSVDFQYDDADGDTLLSDTYQVPVQVQEPAGGGGPPIVPILVVLLVVGGVGYYLYRRRST